MGAGFREEHERYFLCNAFSIAEIPPRLDPMTALFVIMSSGLVLAADPPEARQKELSHLVTQDCGSCHGMSLAGGLGLPLRPETLRDKPRESLVATILHGRAGTAMPPWNPFLTEAEAEWIVEMMLKGKF